MKTAAPYTWDFALDGKAVAEETAGGLVIEGYAANFDKDRQSEAFLPGAFERSLDRYLTTNPVLCYTHKLDRAMGQVLSAKLDGKGLYVKARVDEAEPGTEAADVYRKVASGTIRGFSVGGVFHRKQTPAGPRIHDCDIREISIAPVPVAPETLYKLAGKAFGQEPDLDAIAAQLSDVNALFERVSAAL